MNRRMVLFMLGRIIMLEAFILMLPAACSLIYKEKSFFAFLITIVIAFAVAFVLSVLNKPRDKTIFAKEGFVIVSLAWICFSAVGALPFVISGE
ncbi:MAG: TrkH family potassium uptake protein, partial [Acutalibacteraceae bacterium]|nr:TrkH family potassium uptake protein [Acutalibacteraceae bacterium]